MAQRISIDASFPEVWKAFSAASALISKSDLTPIQKELIKIRASQINACAFCLDMHTKEALRVGETAQRIFLLNAWRETDLFTPEEKAILAVTEEVTLIHENGVTEETYEQAKQYFSEEVIGQIILSAVIINAWNRIAVSTHKPIAK